MSEQKDHSNEGGTRPSTTAHQLRCMGEFPLFPGWLFFERCDKNNHHHILVYGHGGRRIRKVSENREFAIAECLRKILS